MCEIFSKLNQGVIKETCFGWFGSLHPSQQLWLCRDGQFT